MTKKIRIFTVLAIGIFLARACPAAAAAEYFACPRGSDEADGLARESAFRTIGRGVSALSAGDTLTIMPGEYFESVSARLQGEPGAPITIRAWREGTVLLRGCVDVSGFRRVPGTSYAWQVRFRERAEGVADRADFLLYQPVLAVADVEATPASFHQDRERGILYLHTADSSPPDRKALAVSVTSGFGIHLERESSDVVIEGLAFTGYNSLAAPPVVPGGRNRWGILADTRSERITVRRCVAYLNAGGICLAGVSDSVVEDCLLIGNEGRFRDVGVNLLALSGSNVVFRRNTVLGTPGSTLAFYGGARGDGKPLGGSIENNLAVNTSLMIKGGFGPDTAQEGNIVVRGGFFRVPEASNLEVANPEGASALRNFADPVNRDFRLQSDAPARGTGPEGTDPGPFPYRGEVFFVSPEGDDSAAGTSLASAWRTLARAAEAAGPGQTVYITAGTYHETLAPARSGDPGAPVEFRRRGRDRVVLDGRGEITTGIDLSGKSHVRVEGFEVGGFSGPGVLAEASRGIELERLVIVDCGGPAVRASDSAALSLRLSLLRGNAGGGLRLESSPGATVSGNIFDAGGGPGIACDSASLADLYSGRNAFPPAARPAAALDGENFSTLAQWREATGLDENSLEADPGYRGAEKGDFSLLPDSPLIGRGPHAGPVGPFLRVPALKSGRAEHVSVSPITATTATVELWTPGSNDPVAIEWGETEELGRTVRTRPGIRHNASFAGLEPGRMYFYQARIDPSTGHLWAPHGVEGEPAGAHHVQGIFQAHEVDEEPRVFHVATDGDDAADGLSRESAWRTINRANSAMRAGDTVLIHEGVYREFVPVRATGDAGRPITFAAAPGAEVWMEGGDKTIPTAFRIENRHHVVIDGLRFRDFQHVSHGPGPVTITGGSGHIVRRCFYDGRERGVFPPHFLTASGTANLLIENCVVIFGMSHGITISGCPGTTLRHNVFFNNFVYALSVHNPGGEKLTLSHNLFCDVIPGKQRNPLVRTWQMNGLASDHNGYYTRLGRDEKRLFQVRFEGDRELGPEAPEGWNLLSHQQRFNWEVMPFDRLSERYGLDRHSVFGNPGIRVAPQLAPPGRRTAEYWSDEIHWRDDAFQPLDFADFFADPAGPMGRSAAGSPIGLDPSAFE